MPVGDGPADLFLPLTLLVRLVVSVVVDLLAGADQDMDRRPGDERLVPGSDIPLFAADPGNLLPCCLFGHDDVHDALAEPGAGRMLPGLDDALDDLVGYRFLRKVPDHPAFSKHILELHGIKPPLGAQRGCGEDVTFRRRNTSGCRPDLRRTRSAGPRTRPTAPCVSDTRRRSAARRWYRRRRRCRTGTPARFGGRRLPPSHRRRRRASRRYPTRGV